MLSKRYAIPGSAAPRRGFHCIGRCSLRSRLRRQAQERTSTEQRFAPTPPETVNVPNRCAGLVTGMGSNESSEQGSMSLGSAYQSAASVPDVESSQHANLAVPALHAELPGRRVVFEISGPLSPPSKLPLLDVPQTAGRGVSQPRASPAI